MSARDEKEKSSPQEPQFKLKSNLMNKFYNEPVDALDLRLAKAEENFSLLPVDPFTEIKQEEAEQHSVCSDEHPLDYSEVQVATPGTEYLDEKSESPKLSYKSGEEISRENPPLEYKSETSVKDIQRVTLRASSSSHTLAHSTFQQGSSGWRISPIPWRNLLAPGSQDSEEQPREARFHNQSIEDQISPYHFDNRDNLSSKYENSDSTAYVGSRSPPTNLSQKNFYAERVPSLIEGRVAGRINTINYQREHFDRKREYEHIQPSEREFSQAKRFKYFADTQDIDHRISLVESTGSDNPLLPSSELIFPYHHRPYADKNAKLWGKPWSGNVYVPPSEKYQNRCQELIGGRPESFRQNQQFSEPNHVEKTERQIHQTTNQTFSETKPQRMNSVIVRNISGKACNPTSPQANTQQHNEVCKDEGAKYEPKQLLENQHPSFPHDLMDRNLFKKLQNLRAGFAYKVMEAQRNQEFGPPHFHPGDYTNSRFPNHLSRKVSNEIPFSDTVQLHHPHQIRDSMHPKKQMNKTGHKTLYDLANNSKIESAHNVIPKPEQIYQCSSTITSNSAIKESAKSFSCDEFSEYQNPEASISSTQGKGKRGRPRKHAPKLPLPPLYVFIRNLLHNPAYNPSVVAWVDEAGGCFKVTNTSEFAKTWGRMKSNRSEEMNYEKMSRAMRYHYGCERQGRKGHLAMVKEKRLYYR